MSRRHRSSRRKELNIRASDKLNTMVTPDSHRLLLTVDGLNGIANNISKITGRKLTENNTKELIIFIKRLPESQFYNKSIYDAQFKIANMFIDRFIMREKSISEAGDLENVLSLTEITDNPSMSEYQRKEIMQYTSNENQFKHTAHHDRRGNAYVDSDRVNSIRSTPNGLNNKISITKQMVNEKIYKTLEGVKSFIAPDNIDERFDRSKQYWTTFQTISLPHQTIRLDSRNRTLSNTTPNQYKWNIHSAGFPGQLGDNRIQDTLKEVIRIKICPLWIPANNILNEYYSKITLFIKEFSAQSIQYTQFLDTGQMEPTVKNYHFEFEITRKEKNRLYLVPICDTFTFRKPLARIETITICFSDPFETIVLLSDRLTFAVTVGNPTILTSATVHNLTTGDLVYVINYSSASTAVNNEVNRSIGYIATKINNTQISIPVNTIGNPSPDVLVFFGSKRIFLQLEFTSLEA